MIILLPTNNCKMLNKLSKINKKQKELHLQRKDIEEKYNEFLFKTLEDQNNLTMIIDVETTGLPITQGFNNYYHYSNLDKYKDSRIVQISWIILDKNGKQVLLRNFIIKPDGFIIPEKSTRIHGIPNNYANKFGINIKEAITCLKKDLNIIDTIIAHNFNFDKNIILSELYRLKEFEVINKILNIQSICTAETTKDIIAKKIMINYQYINKTPTLAELYNWCFDEKMEKAHDSKYDVLNLSRIYNYLKQEKNIYQ